MVSEKEWISEEEWTDYIRDDSHCPYLRNRLPSVVSIFRVPKFLKDIKIEAYVPQRVSLGPYHHRSPELPPMGHHKGRAFRRMMTRFNANRNLPVDPNNMDFVDRAMEEILKLENKIRDSYEENIDCDRETLARMLCLDGCFLLEVFRTPVVVDYYDPIFGENKLSHAAQDVLSDFLILENQIPFIVLIKLLELESNPAVDVEKKLLDVVKTALDSFNPFYNKNFDTKECSCHHHFLGLLHTVIVSPTSSGQGERVDQCECCISIDCCIRQCNRMLQGKSKEQNDTKSIPHAVELRNAGIKFSALQGGIKDIKFDKNSATIFLPRICIEDSTERVFRNLIAYEMCKPFGINYVISYVVLMNDLIDSEQDVALLRRMRILSDWVGSDKEVADLINRLSKEVTVSEKPVFDNLVEKVNEYYSNEIKVQIGKLVHDHFSSPWTALALTAASVILVLTVLQTIYTIISTYK